MMREDDARSLGVDGALATAVGCYRQHLNAGLHGQLADNHGSRTFRHMLGVLEQLPASCVAHDDDRVQVWSDLHLGHANILKYTGRPFADVADMDACLRRRWLAAARAGELLLCLGDVAMQGALQEATWRMIADASGDNMLIVGNHDLNSRGKLRVSGFDALYSLMIAPGEPMLVLTHMPLSQAPDGWVNVHGHLHAAPPTRSPHINVSVEQTGYRPLPMTQVRALARELTRGHYPPGATTGERIASLFGQRLESSAEPE